MKAKTRKGTKFSKLPAGPKMMKGMGSKAAKHARAKRLAHMPL